MSQSNPTFRMSLIATSVALALINAGCGGAADTTAALAEAALAGSDSTALTLDETSMRRRESESRRSTASSTGASEAITVPTMTSSIQTAATPTVFSLTAPPSTALTTTETTIDPQVLPLVQPENMKYVGSFASPWGLSGVSDFAYSGSAMTVSSTSNPNARALFYTGIKGQAVSEIIIPNTLGISLNFNDLPKAIVAQPFSDLTEGALTASPNTLGTVTNGAFISGLITHQGKLIASASVYYDYSQNASHGISDITLNKTGDFTGFIPLSGNNVAFSRSNTGAMSNIPQEWQSLLGGKIIGGNQPLPIISGNSFGPSITIITPEFTTSPPQLKSETLVHYPSSSPLCGPVGCERTSNNLWNYSSEYLGRMFISGSRSILFVGRHPTGEFWYGGPTSPTGKAALCDDGGWGQKSTAWGYRVMAFDANDLVKVRNGSIHSSQVRPYRVWEIPNFPINDCTFIRSATFDETTKNIYIAQGRGANTRIDVYNVNITAR